MVSALLLLLMALIVAAAFVLSRNPESPLLKRFARDTDDLLAAIPDAEARAFIRSSAVDLAERAETFIARNPLRHRFRVRSTLLAAGVRACLAVSMIPILGVTLFIGTLAGLFRRHLLRENFGFHSTTFSYMGKLLVLFSLAAYVFTGLIPFAPPVWTLYVYSITGALACGMYFGNLPPRL